MQYAAQDDRWHITHLGHTIAFADAGQSTHPGNPLMQWYVAEGGRFMPDQGLRSFVAPQAVQVVGQPGNNLMGSYALVGLHELRPIYQRNDGAIIRYSARQDRWLIDLKSVFNTNGGTIKPGLFTRFSTWLFTGDGQAAEDTCAAHAEARGTTHPGQSWMEWQVFSSRTGRFAPDAFLKTTLADTKLIMVGRHQSQENATICGEYQLHCTHHGRVAYTKVGMPGQTLCFSPTGDRWVIGYGFKQGACLAYAEALSASELPTAATNWHVFDATRGNFIPDLTLHLATVSSILESQQQLGNDGMAPQQAVAYGPATADRRLARKESQPYDMGAQQVRIAQRMPYLGA